MHSSKGLEFPSVSISGIGYMPGKQDDLASEAKLLYVAMTRSTDKLLLTCHKESDFVRMLESLYKKVQTRVRIALENVSGPYLASNIRHLSPGKNMKTTSRIALLIDCDNVSSSSIEGVLEE